jgi:hypothetical protein
MNITIGVLLLIIYFIYKKTKIEKMENDKSIKLHNQIRKGLDIIDKIFNKHNINYTIAYGTLLGAVRHWDMIPWDDDADINVFRKDYQRILLLTDEFKKNGLILDANWKLIKVYFNNNKYPFIDIFINDDINGKIIRCAEPFGESCNPLGKENEWWWKWTNYPSEWIINRKRYKFGDIELWGPRDAEKLLKYWYGEDCLKVCRSAILDHNTGNNIESKIIDCDLPKPQL